MDKPKPPKKSEMNEFAKIVSFEPNEIQSRIKSRFYRRLEEMTHAYDLRRVVRDPGLLEDFCGTKRIHKWLESPGFRAWFLDEHYFDDTMEYLKEKCPNILKNILDNPEVEPKDKLRAVQMIYDQQGAFPSKQMDVRFLDKEIEKMPEHQAKSELEDTRRDLIEAGLWEEESPASGSEVEIFEDKEDN